MARWDQLYQQLKNRRVIRATVVYLALFWLALQVADLLTGSDLAAEQQVQWLIIGGLAIFPVMLILSWFFEHPWHERTSLALLGDLTLILTVAIAAGLLAWQQWTKFVERPVIALIGFTPTDTKESTRDLANHLDKRFGMLLGTLAEIQILDLESTRHPVLLTLPIAEKARVLGADYVIAGTINQSSLNLRINVQLYDAGGELLWSDRFIDRQIDQFELQNSVLTALWPRLGLGDAGLVQTREYLRGCEYPSDREAVLTLVSLEQQLDDLESPGQEQLENLVAAFDKLLPGLNESGLVYLSRARVRVRLLKVIAPTWKSVQHRLLLKDLEEAMFHCPTHPEIGLIRLLQSRELESGADPAAQLARYPNSFELRQRLARLYNEESNHVLALEFSSTAYHLNPLNLEAYCLYRGLLADNSESSDKETMAQIDRQLAGRNPTFDCQ